MTRILIVGNDGRTSDRLATIAAEFAHDVHCVPDGLAGLEALRSRPDWDLVVTDLNMPRLGGLLLLEAMRQDPRIPSIPSIVTAGVNGYSEINAVLAAGAAVFLALPFSAGAARGLFAEYLGAGLTTAAAGQ